jgi:hypothetical protein
LSISQIGNEVRLRETLDGLVFHLKPNISFGPVTDCETFEVYAYLEVDVYTPQGGTKKSALQGCLCPARVLIYEGSKIH